MFVVRDFDSHTRKIEEKNQYSLNSIHSTAQLNSIVKYRLIFFLFSTIRNRMELIFSIQNILGSTSNLPDIINMLEFLMLFHFRIYRFFRNFPLFLSLSYSIYSLTSTVEKLLRSSFFPYISIQLLFILHDILELNRIIVLFSLSSFFFYT